MHLGSGVRRHNLSALLEGLIPLGQFFSFHRLSIRPLLIMTVIYVHELFTASTDESAW